MGLLIGEFIKAESKVVFYSPKVIKRKDKRPDRVEISPADLTEGMETAETLGAAMDKPDVRILGWYHFAPKDNCVAVSHRLEYAGTLPKP